MLFITEGHQSDLYATATFFHWGLNMAAHQIPKSPQKAAISQRLASVGPWLVDGDSWVEWQAVGGDPSEDNVPAERLRGQLANNGSAGEVCFLVRSHPFMCATHYQSSCPLLPQNKAVCVYNCVCVCVFYQNLFISSSDLVLLELERIQLRIQLRLTQADQGLPVFCLESKYFVVVFTHAFPSL